MTAAESPRAPRRWLITGADKGLGHSAAEAALARGDQVVVTVLAPDPDAYALAHRYPGRCRAIHLDARELQRIPQAVAAAEAVFGGIDVLVNNAGYGLIGVAEEVPPEQYRPLFDVNFFAVVETIRAVLPGMRRRRSGHIVNLSSVGAFGASPGFGFYAATKLAVEGYSESLAKEVAPLGIHVTLLEPGGFRSDFAGPSLATQRSRIEDYAATMADYVGNWSASRHRKQANDPAKFGPALCRLVDEPQPPLRLPLGRDGYARMREHFTRLLADIERHQDLTFSTAADD
ncbi:MAG: SDR family NAD(P)-dependent oxidoreductase [Rubrivivax sp.]